MFDPAKVSKLSIPRWEAAYRAEIRPGVVSIIAVHDTSRGYALGGCRMSKYANEAEALTDVLRLSRGMTLKNAAAELPLGGGKSVIIADPTVSGEERTAILAEFGKFVDYVNSEREQYKTAEDMNTTVADMLTVKKHTKHIFGTIIDPSPYTSYGVFCAIECAVSHFAKQFFSGNGSLVGKSVLVQGLGKVGTHLVEMLHEAGARILVSEVRQASIDAILARFPDVTVVAPGDVNRAEVDVYAPCARGEVINDASVKEFACKIICGAANNQLQNTQAGRKLHQRGIVYCPDYVTNMGGVCSIQYYEVDNLGEEETRGRIRTSVYNTLGRIFETALKESISFNQAVDKVVTDMLWGHRVEEKLDSKALFSEM